MLKDDPPHAQAGLLLTPTEGQVATLPFGPPILIVAVDTEAEFDWAGPFLRTHTSVRNLKNQTLAQQVFDRFGVRPMYLVDYAVATKSEGYTPLREVVRSGRCEIGAHLHPWITPPFREELSDRTSFNQNLSISLQREKLQRLTEAIAANLHIQPRAYKAGRYGVGEETASILDDLGYQIDMSVLPGVNMAPICGPDFRKARDKPYWFGKRCRLLEIPANFCFTGLLSSPGFPRAVPIRLYEQISRPIPNRFIRSLGVFARLRLLERIPLTAEGTTLEELRRVTHTRLKFGERVFVFGYHSSSLLPGSTQYVRSASELSRFLETIEGFLQFFFSEVGGIALTPSELRRRLLRTPSDDRSTGLDVTTIPSNATVSATTAEG